jgi:hypothetical protein
MTVSSDSFSRASGLGVSNTLSFSSLAINASTTLLDLFLNLNTLFVYMLIQHRIGKITSVVNDYAIS